MNYRLVKFQLGTSKLNSLLEFQSLFEITDICYVDGFGIILLFKNQHCLGLINKKNKFIFPWAGEPNQNGHRDSTLPLFNSPSSICYCNLSKNVFIIEGGGTIIRKIDLNPFYASSVFGNVVQKKISNYFVNFNNIGEISTSCCTDKNGDIYWLVKELNRCFKYKFNYSDFENYMGNGKYGFSISSDFHSSLVSSPSSILCFKDSVYIADSGNHCIRQDSKVIAGCPNKLGYKDDNGINAILDFPTKMIAMKNLICFIDVNKIRYYSMVDKSVGTLYASSNIISIGCDAKDLLILERK